MARTDTLPHFLTDVADAIREKKGTSETIQASDFNTEIANLPSGGGVELDDYISLNATGTNSSTSYWWLTKFVLEPMKNETIKIGTSETGIAYMFDDCKWSYIPKIATQKNHTNFNMNFTFYSCSNVTSLDLSGITAKLNRLNNTFAGCSALMFLDVRNIDFTGLTASATSFNNVPTNCKIIVKDATQKAWFTNGHPTLTNVKTVAEYEAE